jgi:hypothetical protein
MNPKLLIACISFSAAVAQIAAAQSPTPPPLNGSWRLTFVANSPSPTPAAVPLAGLATFTADGSTIETDATELVPMKSAAGTAVYGSPGHGIWQPGPAVGTLYIQYYSLIVNRNTTLHASKIVTIGGSLDATGNQFSGSYESRLVNPTGHVITTSSGTVTGQRIPHPLLP